jgi:integrase/recombinase XerD
MVTLAAYEGLRVHEIAQVRAEDFAGGELQVRGKGGVASSVPLHPSVVSVAIHMPQSGYWFPSDAPAGHVSRVSVSLAIGRAMKRAGVKGTPHALRHHFGTQVLRASGGDLRTAQRALRHASPATTAIYTQVLDETVTRAVTGIPTGGM